VSLLLCDSGPLIATFAATDVNHERCTQLLMGFLGMAGPVCSLQSLRWVLQET
jgi:hypothetical protein